MKEMEAAEGFLAHVGPITHDAHDTQDGAGSTVLPLGPHHLNIGGRFHGGMVMTLAVAALERAAGEAAARGGGGADVRMLSMDVQFISAALGGARVRADVERTRVTRTMVFLTARLSADGECLATLGAVYRIVAPGAEAEEPPAAPARPDTAGWAQAVWREPFSRHVGSVYECTTPEGGMSALFEVDASRACARRPVMHDGMALFIADVFTGRASARASMGRCVTLGMQVRRLGDVAAGAWPRFETHVRKVSPSVVFTDGVLSCGGQPVMTVASVWKILGAS
ncbi:PaaI family thioesterase [Variovorax sp. Root473]|uniref:PaaI family thioesterase n=1 Tax=Variovorax sp. Root473 TaxID=1736541 RepID=UPI0006F9C173|nr:acyl-CoA thioesterase domain-containing protein [Variovorax sp. Root473]KQX95827.1 hypothetical protein ASD34_00465 [Variovorax sp. Root473]